MIIWNKFLTSIKWDFF